MSKEINKGFHRGIGFIFALIFCFVITCGGCVVCLKSVSNSTQETITNSKEGR
jgi:hypothetical protein